VLDIFVANVSAFGMAMGEDTWRRSFEIDVMGTVAGVEAAVPHLEKSLAGAIVVVGTTGALEMYGAGYVRPYAAVKAALVPYVRGIARSLVPKGVRANLVSPGNIYFKGGVWNTVEERNPRHSRSCCR
jgi:3-oxoacyl-[acyl-carrier protein] reductase